MQLRLQHYALRRVFNVFIASTAIACVMSACGGGSDPEQAPPVAAPITPPVTAPVTPPVPPVQGSQPLSVKGKIVAPDGVTPISNALVYVENSSKPTTAVSANGAVAAAASACGNPPNSAWASSCTGSDGSFNFGAVAPEASKLVAIKGAFKIEKILPAASAGSIDTGNVAFATTAVTGAPKMAVVTGYFDSIENILAKLGFGQLENGALKLGTEKFTIYNGDNRSMPASYASVDKLFVDADGDGKADIFNYQIVFLNCGAEADLSTANKAILRSYVTGGGRIYASDWAYNLVEQVFPEFIDFYGSTSSAAAPEALDAAKVGDEGIVVNATVDPTLKAWLQNLSCFGGPCVQQDGTVKIDGFLSGWAVIDSFHSAVNGIKTWASGNISYDGGKKAVKPLTVTFGVGTGRITYTSYHNEGILATELEPQQRILQYLVFEL